MSINNIERRFFDQPSVEFRAVEDEGGKRFIEGYASVFETRSKLILESGKLFYETIERGAFDDVLKREDLDTKFVFNHDKNKILARTVSKTLLLTSDDRGLFFRAEIPQGVSYAEDVYALIKRGDLFSNSFAFSVDPKDVEWGKDESGARTRTIKRVSGLYDVSVVVDAAYPDTTVAARHIKEIEESEVVKEEPKKYDTIPYQRDGIS